jgi:integrase
LKLSPSSVAYAHTVLAGILDDAVADRRLAPIPPRGVKLPRKTTTKPRNYLTAAQVHSLTDQSKHPDIVLLLATTGLRWGEMAALCVRDIDLGRGRGRIRVERSASKVNAKAIIGTTKTHAVRSVAVSPTVLKLLAPAMVGKSPDELLWCRGDGQPLRPPTTTHWFGAAVKRCQAADAKFPPRYRPWTTPHGGVADDRQRCQRQDGASPTRARDSHDDARSIRPSVPR